MKKCYVCKTHKNFEQFNKNKSKGDGFSTECKECSRKYSKQYNEKFDNKIKRKINADKTRLKIRERDRTYRAQKKVYINKKYNSSIEFRFRIVVSVSVRKAISGENGIKNSSTWKKIPYTPQQLKEHLEKQFDSSMSWDNYGNYWHIDHIYPQSKLPYDSMDHPNFQKCWALENLRPLEAKENIRKGNKII